MIRSIFLLLIFLLGCQSLKEVPVADVSKEVIIDEEEMLLGVLNRVDFQMEPYKRWFDSTYQAYAIQEDVLNSLRPYCDELNIKVVLATWCSDTREWLPALCKVLDYLEIPERRIQLIATERTKTQPLEEMVNLNVEYVPTFIFLLDEREIGRIVESPFVSLEKDMFDIVMGKVNPTI